jgi:hypothetical protein
MTQTQTHPAITHVRNYFVKHPDVKFMLFVVPTDALAAMSEIGWSTGLAIHATLGRPDLLPDHHEIIARRSFEASGHQVITIARINGAPSTPQGLSPGALEGFCRTMWSLLTISDLWGVTEIKITKGKAEYVAASAMIAPAGERHAS